MINNSDNECPRLAQVGFSFNDSISLIGLPNDRNVKYFETPRVVIMEPAAKTNKYNEFHDYYQEIIDELQQKLGEKAELIQLVRGDVYNTQSLSELPPIAFLVLEDVLSDPYYKGTKDFKQLVTLLKKVIISGGVILTLDSRLSSFSDGVKDLVQTFLDLALASGDFSLVLNLLNFEQGTENIQKRDNNQPVETITKELEKLDVADIALKQGLATLKLGIYHCLILQKV